MNSDVLKRLEKYLQENKNEFIPNLRWFDGKEAFSTPTGQYAGDTLEESFDKFLTSVGY